MTINMDTYCSCISSATFPAACSFAQQKTPSNPRSAFANFSTKQLSWKCCVMASANTKQGGPRRRRVVESLKGFGSKVTFTFKIHTYINPPSSHLSALSACSSSFSSKTLCTDIYRCILESTRNWKMLQTNAHSGLRHDNNN